MAKLKLGVIVGSNRRESFNRRLAEALAGLAENQFSIKFIEIGDLPLYNQDLETDLPGSVARFKSEIAEADAILFVTPEHSRSIPALLKSAIDWGARPWGENSWTGRTAAVTGTSPGAISTAVAQQHLRTVLGSVGMQVMGGDVFVRFEPDLFDDSSGVTDEDVGAFLRAFVDQLAAFAGKLAATAAPRAAA